MTRTWRRIVFLSLLLPVLAGPAAGAYTGGLSSEDNGILGTGVWIGDPPATVVWTVTQDPVTSWWHYAYTLNVSQKEVSHVIIETSLGFGELDILNAEGTFSGTEIGWHLAGSANPDIPGDIYGIKFDCIANTTINISFDSRRQPVWGDFYAKDGVSDGTWNALWNAGFTDPDSDPSAPASDGTVDHHLLVPDTIIPEPSSMMVLGIGLAGLLARRRYSGR